VLAAVEAFGNHFGVTWFKNVQRQRGSGKQDEIEGKKLKNGLRKFYSREF
jgi:hypothetical protein